jgi:hypothetical protein
MSASGAANSTPCPEAVLALVERFAQHLDSYNEAIRLSQEYGY